MPAHPSMLRKEARTVALDLPDKITTARSSPPTRVDALHQRMLLSHSRMLERNALHCRLLVGASSSIPVDPRKVSVSTEPLAHPCHQHALSSHQSAAARRAPQLRPSSESSCLVPDVQATNGERWTEHQFTRCQSASRLLQGKTAGAEFMSLRITATRVCVKSVADHLKGEGAEHQSSCLASFPMSAEKEPAHMRRSLNRLTWNTTNMA